MAGDGAVDIDLYAQVDEFEPDVTGQHHMAEGLDLYDDVLTTGAEMPVGPEDEVLQVQYGEEVTGEVLPEHEAVQSGAYEYKSYTTVHPKSAAARSSNTYYERNKGKPLYVGNLTWWTNDQELTEALQECGVTDLINIKFFENRTNGQSKGMLAFAKGLGFHKFAMIELGSETSCQLVTEKLPKMEIHSQFPVVTPATKQFLQQFEAQSRKNNPGAPGGGHAEHEGPGYQQGGGRGFGYNRGGFRGRGGFPVRPGMGRGFDHGPPPGDMGHGGPWMGPGHMGMPRHPPPGMPPYAEHPPPYYPMVHPPHGDKPPGPMPPQMHVPPQPPPPGAGPMPDHRAPGMVPHFPKPPVAPHVNPAFFPEGPPPDAFLAAGGPNAMSQFMPRPADEYSESMKRNQVLASSAIKRAMADANAGDYESGIETLVGAISLIKQSPTAVEERCQVLVQSLQDCLQGLEAQLLERRSIGSKHHYSEKDDFEGETREKRHRRSRRSRSRSRDRDRRSRSRDKRSRSRDRERRHRR